MTDDDVTVEQQADLTEEFLAGLLAAFGVDGRSNGTPVDEDTIEVQVAGDDLGLLIGPKGQTLLAVQDLARTYVQRKATGIHHGRVRIDVGGYRQRRREALQRFARQVATEVHGSGVQKALEPMARRRSQGRARRGEPDRGRADDLRGRGPAAAGRHHPGVKYEGRVPSSVLRDRPIPSAVGGRVRRRRRRGLIGGGDLDVPHVRQAEAFAAVIGEVRGAGARPRQRRRAAGSGAGGAAGREPADAARRRARERSAFLRDAVARLGLEARVRVAEGRAEELGHRPESPRPASTSSWRGPSVAPAVVAECGAPFLGARGSTDRERAARWRRLALAGGGRARPLAELGLMAEERIRSAGGFGFQVLRAKGPCPGKYPRRTGIPTKRPLFLIAGASAVDETGIVMADTGCRIEGSGAGRARSHWRVGERVPGEESAGREGAIPGGSLRLPSGSARPAGRSRSAAVESASRGTGAWADLPASGSGPESISEHARPRSSKLPPSRPRT